MKRTGKREGDCLNPDCKRKADSRGLCETCYKWARKAVKEGKISWVELEARGKVAPLKRPRSTARDWLLGLKNDRK